MDSIPFRQIHMDFHTSGLISGVGDGFDPEEFAGTLKKARANSINLFAKCHHGMYYYPTRIGTMHPGLKFDLLGAQMEACRDNGIRACIYTCVAWNEDWSERHPEWQQVNAEGILGIKKPFDSQYYAWRYLCLRNPAHRAYLKSEFDETYESYHPDGYWIDIIFQRGCVCSTCKAEMKQLGLDPENPGDVQKHDRYAETAFMKEFYEYLKAKDENLGIYFNGCPYEMDLGVPAEYSAKQKRLYNTSIDIESLPSDLWGYTHFPIAVNFLNRGSQELTMMNGKFHKAWGDFGSLRNLEALEYECFRALANGARVCVGDQLHPSGRIDQTVYARIGEVFKSIEAREKWCEGTTKVSQIGVYASNLALQGVDASSEGVYRILSELHHLFDFIDYESDIPEYGLVILPDSVRIPEQLKGKLQKYLSDGGKLLLTGESGLRAEDDVFALEETGVAYGGPAEYNPRYMRLGQGFFSDIPPMDYVTCERGIIVKALAGTEVLAYSVNPYFNRTHEHFCSHRQAPPSEVTSEACITKNGNVMHISNPLFRDYAINGNRVYRDIVSRCIEMLLEKPLLQTDLPSTAELTLRRQGKSLILHALHYIPQKKSRTVEIIDVKIPLYNGRARVYTEYKPESVSLAPQGKQLAFDFREGYTEFVIPEVNGYQIVTIEL